MLALLSPQGWKPLSLPLLSGKAWLHHFSVDFFSFCILPFSLFKHKNFFLLKLFL